MEFFQHPTAIVETQLVGAGTRVWAYAHILPGARIGSQCNICDHTFIENDVVVGDRVTVKCGVQLWDGVTLEDDVFVGPNATFTNDRFPRSRHWDRERLRTVVRRGASIGANATVLPGIEVGENAMIGAGAVVTRNVPSNAVAVGNPARIRGYVNADEMRAETGSAGVHGLETQVSRVRGVTLYRLPKAQDLRGSLAFAEIGQHVPFEVKRYFVVYAVPSKEVRGEHAHKTLHQFLVCVSGSCRLVADDGAKRQEFVLDSPQTGLHLPPMVWGIQYQFTQDAVLLVLASDHYDSGDYLRDYREFTELVKAR